MLWEAASTFLCTGKLSTPTAVLLEELIALTQRLHGPSSSYLQQLLADNLEPQPTDLACRNKQTANMLQSMLSLLGLILLAAVHGFCPQCVSHTPNTALRAAPDSESHYSGFDVAKRSLTQHLSAVHMLEDRVNTPTPPGGPNSNFTVNLGHCISTLTEDLPYLFESAPDMSIFTQDIVLKVRLHIMQDLFCVLSYSTLLLHADI
jgi:hypothetical protein